MTFDERVAAYLETGEWDPAWGPVPPDLVTVRERLADGASWVPPPDGGLEALQDAIARELADADVSPAVDGVPGDLASGAGTDRGPVAPATDRVRVADRVPAPGGPAPGGPAPARPGGPAHRRRRGVTAWLGAAATVAVAVVAVLVLVRGSGPPDAVSFELAGTDVVPGATATGMVWSTGSGEWFELEVSGLPPAEADAYYAGWVHGDAGVVSIGTFHARDDDTIHLWSGVPVEDYPDITITRQLVAEGAHSSGEVVLEGRVTE